MNRTLLLILCDFLLLNLLALTRWENAEPTQPRQPPVPELAANSATAEDDLFGAMRESLADERALREQASQELAATTEALSSREDEVAALEEERTRLSGNLLQSQQATAELEQQVATATRQTALTQEQLAQMQRDLEQARSENERRQEELARLEQQQAEARQRIENLSVAVQVAEQEKVMLRETAENFRQQALAERDERERVQQANVQLAEGVGQLAAQSSALTQEIRDNRPINVNVLYNDYLANRVHTTVTASRSVLIGAGTRSREAETVFVTDGQDTFALLHLNDTPFNYLELASDWTSLNVAFDRPPSYSSKAASLRFLALDPRVIAVPVTPEQVEALGVKVYQTALDPMKFSDVVLIGSAGRGYGEISFKIDASQPGYVQVDNRLVRRLFGDYAPASGDLVLSKTGELLGIMVSSDYCALVSNFLSARTVETGDGFEDRRVLSALTTMAARYRGLPFRMQ